MKNPILSVKIGKLKLNNPVIVASGTFGYAKDFLGLLDLTKIGAIITKTITLKPREGNSPPRTTETSCGILNSIGLENPGIELFLKQKLPFLRRIGVPVIVSIMAESIDEFGKLVRVLDRTKGISAIELNLSCPNIKVSKSADYPSADYPAWSAGRPARPPGRQVTRLIAQDPKATYRVVKAVRKLTNKTLIAKLSPNVTDITQIAKAAVNAGADILSLINTFFGLAIDIKTRRPKLGSATGGLSGPAIKPIALNMVSEVFRKTESAIIGGGGIMTAADAIEFLVAGATAVSIGTANFVNPAATIEIIQGIKRYLIKNKISDINSIIGSLKV